MIKNASKCLLALVVAFILSIPAFSQYNSSELKSIEKAKAYYAKGKYDKAISTLKKVQLTHYYENDLWELRCNYEYDRYQVQLITDFLAILKKAGKGGNVNFDFSKMKSTAYRSEMIGACSTATLICPKQETASWVLHEQFLEPSVDTALAEEAKEAYDKASDDYSANNFTAAIRAYEKALKIDSNYYNASYKIAMCYYKDEKFEKAIPYYQKAIRIEPKMIDPRHNLVNCHIKLKNWQDAYSACVDGIIQYPDIRFFSKMDEICDKLGKTFNRHWMARDYMPSMLSATGQVPIQDEPWSYYRQAKDKIADYCNDEGVIKKKLEFTEQKYLETYSWEFMLKKSTTEDKEFGFAREMQKAGYLDCFAMVSMYHITFSEQYEDFSKNNGERIRTYINTYLVK
ncbi:MAG: tetratricopeptide repeat protein [Bacteroidota bacterium]|nr:tetratricopeptide repeat protein [Bacteroidota bacterium]